MKKNFLGLILIGSLFLASCGTNRTMSYITSIDANNYELEVTPMIATLDVDNTHVTGEFHWDGKKRAKVDYDIMRDNAIYNALQKRQCDVLVAPQYQIVTDIRGGRKYITVTVTGYPAKYVNFTPAPQPNALELQELKDDANYVIIAKDSEGSALGYQVIVPYDKNLKTLDLDQTTVDKIILDGKGANLHRPKKAPRRREPAEPQSFIEKIAGKKAGNMAGKKK